jgi:hypothetical protein
MRKKLLYGLAAPAIVALIGGTAAYFYGKRALRNLGPKARQRVIQALEQRFDADVELNSLQIALSPRPTVTGEGLSIRHRGWSDPAPIISVRRFTAETDYDTVIAKKNHVDLVRLEGLEIHIPPRGRGALIRENKQDSATESEEPGNDKTHLQFTIETIIADGTVLVIEAKKQGKDPLEFDIEKLTLHNAGPEQAMTFTAKLMNAKPPGLIDSSGKFGPWQRDEPRLTAVSGDYKFQNADLGVFAGISGILSSTGKYRGVLERIQVDGTTDTPKFALKRGGDPVHLIADFHSIVDGTNGDTILDPVRARFLHSEFICKGGVVHHPGTKGKTVSLNAIAPHARMEDILTLIVGSGKPLLTGGVNFKSKILIPPGPADVLDKLELDGQFAISSARFSSPAVEQRLRTLSNRARGISKNEEQDAPPQTIASNFQGRFKLDDGVVSFSKLSFSVPGAAIDLAGKYNLRSEEIDMSGKFRMEAALSETQSGVKHWVLKPFDKFFEKNGAGFEVPVTVGGTKEHPEIGTEVFHKHVTIH